MKRIRRLCVALVLLSTCTLFACSNSDVSIQNVEASTSSGKSDAPSDSPDDTGTLTLVTDLYGGGFRNGASNQYGYYEIMKAQADYINVLYTDYETKNRTYLCANPDCLHNSDSCTSCFPPIGAAYLFANEYQNKVYLVAAGTISDETVPGSTSVNGCIYDFNPDGSNRNVLYRLQSNEQFSGTAAANNLKMYAGVQVADPETAKTVYEIREIDLKTGGARTIYSTENGAERIFGAYSDCLVLEEVDDTSRKYHSLNVITGQKSETEYSYDYTADVRTELADKNFVYSLRSDGYPNASLYRIDLISGSEERIAADIAIYDVDTTTISGIFENHVEIETSDNRTPGNIKLIKYIVNADSGACSTSKLQYEQAGQMRNVYILAENEDFFLVRNGAKLYELTVTDNTGTPSTFEASFPQYALIQKSDYWDNIANYQAINDNV